MRTCSPPGPPRRHRRGGAAAPAHDGCAGGTGRRRRTGRDRHPSGALRRAQRGRREDRGNLDAAFEARLVAVQALAAGSGVRAGVPRTTSNVAAPGFVVMLPQAASTATRPRPPSFRRRERSGGRLGPGRRWRQLCRCPPPHPTIPSTAPNRWIPRVERALRARRQFSVQRRSHHLRSAASSWGSANGWPLASIRARISAIGQPVRRARVCASASKRAGRALR